MKFLASATEALVGLSHPARGAWIEIEHDDAPDSVASQSHPARGAWIEM